MKHHDVPSSVALAFSWSAAMSSMTASRAFVTASSPLSRTNLISGTCSTFAGSVRSSCTIFAYVFRSAGWICGKRMDYVTRRRISYTDQY